MTDLHFLMSFFTDKEALDITSYCQEKNISLYDLVRGLILEKLCS